MSKFMTSVVLAIYRCGSWETGVKETSEAVKTARGRRFPVCWGPIWAQQPGRTTDESQDNLGTSGGTRIKSWSLTSLQQRLMKTGGRLVKHPRYYWLLLAEGHLNRRLFGDMLHRIWALPPGSG